MKVGDKVKITQIIDGVGGYLQKYIGQIGIVRRIGDGLSVDTMLSITFDDGVHDAFWAEEIVRN